MCKMEQGAAIGRALFTTRSDWFGRLRSLPTVPVGTLGCALRLIIHGAAAAEVTASRAGGCGPEQYTDELLRVFPGPQYQQTARVKLELDGIASAGELAGDRQQLRKPAAVHDDARARLASRNHSLHWRAL